jgi:hypothetical protein
MMQLAAYIGLKLKGLGGADGIRRSVLTVENYDSK